ncbi:hypothetical protein FMUND_2625 [Fusarium mundagurra]|uniref:Uncharacterized protein n=1 Tax=Fusarium mundagurra TaxID=1567541 RepID=A0A8H5Z4E3_9HYPO|nr:hypothetical protein FMUND_2625 [Fusarium mundagurra]
MQASIVPIRLVANTTHGWLARSKCFCKIQIAEGTIKHGGVIPGTGRQEKNRPNVSDSESERKCPSRHESQQSRSCLVASNHLQLTTLDNLFKIADSPHAEVFAEAFHIRVSSDEELFNGSTLRLCWLGPPQLAAKPSTCPSSLDVIEGNSAVKASRRSLQSQVSASGLEMAWVPIGLRHLGSRVDDKSLTCIPGR